MTEDRSKRRAARRGDWKTEPMPEKRETFVLDRPLSDAQIAALRQGNVPQGMEDKWFWYMEGQTLWAHRSWTGYCIYRIDLKEDGRHTVTVNRDPEQYSCTSIDEDTGTLNKLLDWWTEVPYDHYNEWLSETSDALKGAAAPAPAPTKDVYIDGIHLGPGQVFGIKRYALEILAGLDEVEDCPKVHILYPKDVFEKNRRGFKRLIEESADYEIKGSGMRAAMWQMRVFPKLAKDLGGISLNFGLHAGQLTDIYTLHDCIFLETLKDNKGKKRLKAELRAAETKYCVNRCRLLMTVSEYSRDRIAETYGLPKDRFRIVPCGWQHYERVEEDPTVVSRLGLTPKGYFFALGSMFPYKNIRWIREAARQNPGEFFVVTGGGKTDADRSSGNLLYTGYLSDGECKALMRSCKAFLQPSFSEGFGIPPMEAMSVGARAIVSNAGSLPEVYRDSVWYIDPSVYEPIRMDEIMQGDPAPSSLVLDRFSWKRSAELLAGILREEGE